jgi:UPF0716 protein FxsA
VRGYSPTVVGPLALLFLVVPFVELFVLIQVGQSIGALPTILILIAVSVVGAALVKREGLGVLRRAQARVEARQVPGQELVDGVLILFAGALLLTPGFLTDLLGISLLLPPVRALFRGSLVSWLGRRASVSITRGPYR